MLPFARSKQELDLLTGPGETVTVLEMQEEEFRRTFQRLTGREADNYLKANYFLNVSSDSIDRLLQFWDSVLQMTNAGISTSFGIIDLVASLVSAMELPEAHSIPRLAKGRLIEGILSEAARSGFKATVPELSIRLGIARRTIEYAFRENLGISPQAYFNLRRLNACHFDLTKADPGCDTVTDIVLRRGFHELGRFATIYRRHFGELPSETLRKADRPLASRVWPMFDLGEQTPATSLTSRHRDK